MPSGSRPFPAASFSMEAGLAQAKIPEFPACFLCIHSQTSSKFLVGFFMRITPTGLPVQEACPPSQVHVFGLQFTFTKSSPVSSRHPCPVPSIKAFFTSELVLDFVSFSAEKLSVTIAPKKIAPRIEWFWKFFRIMILQYAIKIATLSESLTNSFKSYEQTNLKF